MKRLRAFLIPFAIVFALALGLSLYLAYEPTPDRPERIDFSEATTTRGYVRLEGMAHYAAVVRQDAPGSLFREPTTYWLYGFFPPYDTESRQIEVLVRSEQQPEDLVHYELMAVTGWLDRATPQEVPFEAEVILGKNTDYFFTDDVMLLRADRLEPIQEGGGFSSRLAPPPDSPNCVSSRADPSDEVHYIEPLALPASPEGLERVLRAIEEFPRCEVVEREARYAHAVCRTRIFRFKDDLEVELDPEEDVVHIRSASRVGYGDMGVNRARVEQLRAKLAE